MKREKPDYEYMINLYNDGMDCQKIADKTGFPYSTVYSIMRRKGINRGNKREISYEIREDGCWICTSHKPNNYGYVCINTEGRETAHRYFYRTRVGEIPNGFTVVQSCNVRNCINPSHLILKERKNEIEYKVDERNCWICTSHSTDQKGYPRSQAKSRGGRLNRYMYKKYKGDIPKGLLVRHTCDNPNCINPDHLIVGTHQDNVQDRMDRKRSRHNYGESNHMSKFSDDVIEFIKNNENIGPTKILRMFGMSRNYVYYIRSGRNRNKNKQKI